MQWGKGNISMWINHYLWKATMLTNTLPSATHTIKWILSDDMHYDNRDALIGRKCFITHDASRFTGEFTGTVYVYGADKKKMGREVDSEGNGYVAFYRAVLERI